MQIRFHCHIEKIRRKVLEMKKMCVFFVFSFSSTLISYTRVVFRFFIYCFGTTVKNNEQRQLCDLGECMMCEVFNILLGRFTVAHVCVCVFFLLLLLFFLYYWKSEGDLYMYI